MVNFSVIRWSTFSLANTRLEEPEGAGEKYAQMNRLLVERFASLLKMLEAGEDFSPEREEAVVQEAGEELARVFSPR